MSSHFIATGDHPPCIQASLLCIDDKPGFGFAVVALIPALIVGCFQQTFFAILDGALLVALLIALFLDARITRPIIKLTESAEKVSMGGLLDEVTIDDKGEIGQLANAFERMRVSMVECMRKK